MTEAYPMKLTPVGNTEVTSKVVDVVPRNRIYTYAQAEDVYNRGCQSHIPLAAIYAKVDKLFDGLPPYNPETLKKLNQGHVNNTNFGDARNREEKGVGSYYNIFYSNKFLAEINFHDTPEFREILEGDLQTEVADVILKDWSNIATEEWTRLMRVGWSKDFFSRMSTHLKQCMRYGRNCFHWEDIENWMFSVGTAYSDFVTDDASVNCDENDVHIRKHQMSISRIIDIYENDNLGLYKKDVLAQIIIKTLEQRKDFSSYEEESTDIPSFIERVVRDVRDHNNFLVGFENQKVDVVTLLVKEFDFDGNGDGVSHLMFTPELACDGLMFFKNRAYDKMSEGLLISYLLPGSDKVKDAKGQGQLSYGPLLELTRQKAGLATNLKIDGTTFLTTETNSVADIRKITMPIGAGAIALLPNTISLAGQRSNVVSQSTIAAVEYFERDADKNSLFLSTANPNPEAPVSTQQRSYREAIELQEKNIVHYFATTLDPLYQNIFLKQLKYQNKSNSGAKLFQGFLDSCERRGIPKIVFEYKKSNIDTFTGLPTYLTIHAYKATGTGSQVADYQRIQDATASGIPQSLGARGLKYFEEQRIAAIFGQAAVAKYMPEADQENQPTIQDVMADTVTNDLEEGKPIRWSPDLNHAVFAETIITRMGQVIQAYMEGRGGQVTASDPEERQRLIDTNIALQALGNFGGLSLTVLAEDPLNQQLFRSLYPIFQQMEGIARGIYANAQKAMESAAQEKAQMAGQDNLELQKIIMKHEKDMLGAKLKGIVDMYKAKGSFNIDMIKLQNESIISQKRLMKDLQIDMIAANADNSQNNTN